MSQFSTVNTSEVPHVRDWREKSHLLRHWLLRWVRSSEFTD